MDRRGQNLDATVVIGRFQPFHKGHESLIRYAMDLSPQTVIILGSHKSPRTCRNVWTSEERGVMIRSVFTAQELSRLHIIPVEDNPDNDLWVQSVYRAVQALSVLKVALVGHRRDETSFYMDLFSEWPFVAAPEFDGGVSGTQIRDAYFETGEISDAVPKGVQHFLKQFSSTLTYEQMKKERALS